MFMFDNFYRGKKVLVTGHTGFKGSWLTSWLIKLGADVVGYSLDPKTSKDNFVLAKLSEKILDVRGDINDENRIEKLVMDSQPDLIFHLAAQPLVRESYENPVSTYKTNLLGTINILEAIRKLDKKNIAIMVTTDKCYENKEQIWGYRETDALGGYDPYSSSKAAAEIAINSWRQSFFNRESYVKHLKSVASVRAGNVIGGGDWSKDRIIPDCIKSIEDNEAIEIRNPNATRPWQHVLEPLYGYLLLAYKLSMKPTEYAEAWNFGPYINSIISVQDIANKMVEVYGKGFIKTQTPSNQLHEANLLALDITKSYSKLNWKPILSIDETINFTVDWYRKYRNTDVLDLNIEQISKYEKILENHV